MTYNIGDLVVFIDKTINRKYTGLITDSTKSKHWWGGGYYTLIWEYPENYQGIKDDKVSFEQLRDWVNDKEADIYPARK